MGWPDAVLRGHLRLGRIPDAHGDPTNKDGYKFLADQLMGETTADDLFSGAMVNSDTPWWGGGVRAP